MSDAAHLLIPAAGSSAPGARAALQGLALPGLERLLARLEPAHDEGGDPLALSMPHEHALARACALPGADGLLPWAAWERRQAGDAPDGTGWAWITPCHWRLGTDHAVMLHPQQLQLDAQDSRALLEAMRPYFAQDGLVLAYDAPTRWLATGELFARLPVASLDRVVGQVLDPWMPRGDAGRPLRRLQQEMQMLLYTHPVNEARTEVGLLPVNSFWASGAGALPTGAQPARPPGLAVVQPLRDAALLHDWAAWASAWQDVDARDCARLLQALDAGRPVALTLCGDRLARTWRSPAGGGLRRRLAALWTRPRAASVLEDL